MKGIKVVPEATGISVQPETNGDVVQNTQFGVCVKPEKYGILSGQIDEGNEGGYSSYWAFGSGEWVLLGSGNEIDL